MRKEDFPLDPCPEDLPIPSLGCVQIAYYQVTEMTPTGGIPRNPDIHTLTPKNLVSMGLSGDSVVKTVPVISLREMILLKTVLQKKTMRSLTSILALLGGIWAFAGIAGWIMAILSIQYIESGLDVAKTLITIILLLSGYFVWWGWVFYSFKGRFPFMTTRAFWVCSLIHHIACVLYLLPMDVWGGGDDPWWIPVWIIGNVLISVIVLIRQSEKQVMAKQGSAPNPLPAESCKSNDNYKP